MGLYFEIKIKKSSFRNCIITRCMGINSFDRDVETSKASNFNVTVKVNLV